MDRFVKNFILMSIVYLTIATVLGIFMLGNPSLMQFKFVHSHLMLLGWVSMMIYGVGYHILPKFAGRFLKSKAMERFSSGLRILVLWECCCSIRLGHIILRICTGGLLLHQGLLRRCQYPCFFTI